VTPPRTSAHYRHVDGIRCLAILSVVFYHAGLFKLGGGFVGVDVFFVISGFLIISGLHREISNGGIDFLGFYFRRVRRLFPALLPMVATTLAVGSATLTPVALKALAASAISAIFFGANIYYYSKGGYFAPAAESLPLLHTWSLGVEEQFYIVIPALIALAWKILGRRYHLVLIALAAASLAASIATVAVDPDAAFYLAPLRAWELLAGGIVAIFGTRLRSRASVREVVALLGLVSVVASILLYRADMPFPGARALLPVAGAAALIWADLHGRTRVGRLLSLGPLVWIGGLSYALYLWHWPIFVYGRIIVVDDPSDAFMLGLTALAVLAAWLSTRFIEDRVQRTFDSARPMRLLIPVAVSVALVSGAAAALFLSGGWPSRISPDRRRLAERATWMNPDMARCFTGTTDSGQGRTIADIEQGRVCRLGITKDRIDFLLWGDSHAEAIRPAFDAAARRLGLSGAYVGEGGCPPIPGSRDVLRGSDYHCLETNAAAMALIRNQHIPLVVLHSRWVGVYAREVVVPGPDGAMINGGDTARMTGAIIDNIRRLKALGTTTVVMGAMPQPGYNVPEVLTGLPCCGGARGPFQVRAAWRERAQRINGEILGPALKAEGVPFADPLLVYCRGNVCPINIGKTPLYYDYTHVSVPGATLFVPEAERLLRQGMAAGQEAPK